MCTEVGGGAGRGRDREGRRGEEKKEDVEQQGVDPCGAAARLRIGL